MADFSDRAFKGEEVVLDGNEYRRCSFEDVTLVYGGGALTMAECKFISFRCRFTGELANGLHALYQLFGQEGMLTIIRGFTEPVDGEIVLPGQPG